MRENFKLELETKKRESEFYKVLDEKKLILLEGKIRQKNIKKKAKTLDEMMAELEIDIEPPL